MHLNDSELKNSAQWAAAGIALPAFDREKMIASTESEPTWVHFGAGNIFRAFPAALQQNLLNRGLSDKGIIAVEGYDGEIIEKSFLVHDNLSLLVTLKADGTIEKTVIGSVAEALRADCAYEAEFARLKEIFRADSLQMVSFTITEKGYCLTQSNGEMLADVKRDIENGPAKPQSYMGKVSSLCYERYISGSKPVALVSMDNCSHNGEKLFAAIFTFAEEWAKRGLVDDGFVSYISNPELVSFPWSMIDKITPRPDASVCELLKKCGFEDTEGVVSSKGTYTAPFVNAEEKQYLVIEDRFPNGRPPLEESGVIFTDRDTVEKVERMKVCTCLNPLHTALAIFGCLLGYTRISEEMKDNELTALIKKIGYTEGLPVVTDPGIISPKAFIDELMSVRLPNPFMPDSPQRIATDTSQKIPVRYGETLKAYLENGSDISGLVAIPLTIAGWCRYLTGIDDEGKPFELSPDPMLGELRPIMGQVKLGDTGPFHDVLYPILSNQSIFAVDLYKAGLGEKIEKYFEELIAGPGAVRKTLREHLAN